MSEGHGEPPADVRAFLPRPGEPVEDYAERLRALHRDLTLVLQAVERGLAVAAEQEVEAAAPPEAEAPAAPQHAMPPDVRTARERARPAEPATPVTMREETVRGGARVEVMPVPGGTGRPPGGEERREPPRFVVPGDEERGGPAPPATVRFPPRPSARSSHGPAPVAGEPTWIEGPELAPAPPPRGVWPPEPQLSAAVPPPVRVEATYRPAAEPRAWTEPAAAPPGAAPPAPAAPPAAGRSPVPPVLVAAMLAGWLLAVALLLALLLG